MYESLFTYLDLAGTSHAMPNKLVEFMDQFIKEEAMLCKSMPHQHISRSNIMARIFARTLISSAENDSRDKAHQSDLQTDLLRAGTPRKRLNYLHGLRLWSRVWNSSSTCISPCSKKTTGRPCACLWCSMRE
jgi:hypothetical protein